MNGGECVAVGVIIGRGDRSTRRKPVPVPLSSPQIPHDQTWDRTRALAKYKDNDPIRLPSFPSKAFISHYLPMILQFDAVIVVKQITKKL
jgi:hypothetical protein